MVTVDVGRMLTAHVSNVYRCGSSWSCPLCAPVVRQRRAEEIDAALRRHLDAGGGALFLTVTLRHKKRDTLASRLDVVSQSMRLILQGEPWQRRKRALGYVGNIKAIDITWGEANGWHAHAHVLLLFDAPVSEAQRSDLETWVFGRWSKIAENKALGTVTRAHGVDLRQVTTSGDLAEYLTTIDSDWSPGLELARTDIKRWSPFDLLTLLMQTGDVRYRALWLEYEEATFNKRSVKWSPGLRARLTGVEKETPDEELAASEGIDLTLFRALVPTDVWNATVRNATTGELLTEIECVAGVCIFIADLLGHDLQPLDLEEVLHGDS
jgi:Replication protein